MSNFKFGDRIGWIYFHYFNSTTGTPRKKFGIFQGCIRHTIKHWRKNGSEQMAYVLFDNNKYHSKVRLSTLTKDDRVEQL